MKTYTKAVSATLAGALAVGMVPAMALADDDVVELQASDTAVIKAGTISAFAGVLPEGNAFAYNDDLAEIVPIAIADGGAVAAPHNVDTFKVFEYNPVGTDADSGDFTLGGEAFDKVDELEEGKLPVKQAGNYVIFAKVGDTWVNEGVAFTVLPEALSDDIVVYEKGTSKLAEGYLDTELVYNGIPFKFDGGNGQIGLAVDGADVGVDEVVGIYDVATNQKLTDNDDLAAAGERYVLAKFGTTYVKVPYAVQKLDLGKAEIVLNDTVFTKGVSTNAVSISTINGKAPVSGVTLSVSENLVSAQVGPYTATVGLNAAGKANPNIVDSSKVIDIMVVGAEIDPVVAYTGSFDINRADEDYKATDEFDASKLAVTYGATTYTDYDLVVVKEVTPSLAHPTGWAEVDPSELTNKATYGTFKVKAVLDSKALNYAVAGETDELTFVISNGTITGADVAWANATDANITRQEYGNASVDTVKGITYTGADFMDDLVVSVKANGKAVPASDYSVEVKKYNAESTVAADGWEDVDAIVDAGQYKVEVVSSKYVVSNAEIYVDVEPVNVKAYRADQVQTTKDGKYNANEFLYTGEAVNPVEFFAVSDGAGDFVKKDGELQVVDVPASAYKVNITQFIPEGSETPVLKKDLPTDFVAAGEYTYTIVDAAPGKDNYTIDPTTVDKKLVITAKSVFPDVASDAWYADEVLVAAQNSWIGGYDNGLYGPNDGMKRGDLALVLARYLDMAAPKDTAADGTIGGLTNASVDTGFADVKGTAYYAWAVKAMAEAGIITGYDDGTYGAEDLVTRQMLATILARIDASGLGDASILASALDAYADGDEVAGWAVAGVEWAVESGVMGVGTQFLNPADTVTRAEAAAMLVRYDAL